MKCSKCNEDLTGVKWMHCPTCDNDLTQQPEPRSEDGSRSSSGYANEGKLSSCPFCGGDDISCARKKVEWRNTGSEHERIVAVCRECGAAGPAFGPMSMTGESTARQYWNRRANERNSHTGGDEPPRKQL